MATLTSANGFLSLLEEEETELKVYALQKLDDVVDQFWAEVADSIEIIEQLAEDEEFVDHHKAALLASKVYYHLGAFEDSMRFAFMAGDLFDKLGKNEYTEALTSFCIDEYIKKRQHNYDATSEEDKVPIDPLLKDIVELMFVRCFNDKGFKQALGIALEARRFDKIEEAIRSSENIKEMCKYCFDIAMSLIPIRDYRQKVLELLVKIYREQESPDFITICRILVFLNDSYNVAGILENLIEGTEDEFLLSLQIAFDLVQNSTQQFLIGVRSRLPVKKVGSSSTDNSNNNKEEEEEEEEDDDEVEGPTSMETTPLIEEEEKTPSGGEEEGELDEAGKRKKRVVEILKGETTINLYLEFLHRNNHADMVILKNTKTAVEQRNSVIHSATVFSNAIMNAGTTKDKFLRDNLDWFSKATNWAKFSATAGLGVIHKGHLKEGMNLLSPYLPKEEGNGSPFSEGGALFGLGIIHSNHGETVKEYLLDELKNAGTKEVLQHGACLGLGIAAMATQDKFIYETMKNYLDFDNAVVGEAVGYGMGLVMLGSQDEEVIEDMLSYCHETQHEKIIRGLAIGIALINYGLEEQADHLIDLMTSDKDYILRYGGMFTIALAYCGTGNNRAIRRLLHFAVSDVSDDVRRAAVMCLGFVLSRSPENCPRMVQLLSESYNPHVRYGACMAIGIACVGTANKEALDILVPMADDVVDFVRQGAQIALSMVLIQATTKQDPKVDKVRQIYIDKINNKHENTMAKFGAILSQGIIDAGGRNVTIALHSRAGHKNMVGIAGLAMFVQYWFWHPLIHFLPLAFSPTAIIGLNKDLNMPKFQFQSNKPPSTFAYPEKLKPPEKKEAKKVETAVLSTTKKAKKFAEKKAKEKGIQMDIDDDKKEDDNKNNNNNNENENDSMDVDNNDNDNNNDDKKKNKKKKEVEPEFETKNNPARVTLAQLEYISLSHDDRYVPIRSEQGDAFGIVILKDTKPDLPEVFVNPDEDNNNNNNNDNDQDDNNKNSDDVQIESDDESDN